MRKKRLILFYVERNPRAAGGAEKRSKYIPEKNSFLWIEIA
jgi:hypothetical protein